MVAALLDRARWEERLGELAGEYGVPGAVLGIARGDQAVEVACGVANVDTGVGVTPDTVFQIGSIAKVWTATVVMRLAEEGRLDLDGPVVTYLPELRLADPQVTRTVTMRHLLTTPAGSTAISSKTPAARDGTGALGQLSAGVMVARRGRFLLVVSRLASGVEAAAALRPRLDVATM
jgi:CubicO group peptidase (beta-lactamase class C family)